VLRRLGFRRVLPVVQIALYVALIWPECVYLYRASSWRTASTLQLVLWQEGEGMEFHPIYIDRATPVRVTLAVLLNFPAVFPVGMALSLFLPSGPTGQLVVLWASLPCIFFLWYAVGLWIDRRLSFIPSRSCKFSRLRRGMWAVLYVMSFILVCLLIGYLGLVLFYVRKELSDVRPREIALFASLLLPVAWWVSFAFMVSRSGFRRVRAAAPQKT
jgi:hypothetical protein